MKSKSIFLMAVSLGFGLVAAIGITQVMGRNKAEPVAEVEKQTVLVAVEDLDINTELTPEMFSEEQSISLFIRQLDSSHFKYCHKTHFCF